MKNETPKRNDYPVAFRFKKEVVEKLNELSKTLGMPKSKIMVGLIMKNNLEHIEKIEAENRKYKEKIAKLEKVEIGKTIADILGIKNLLNLENLKKIVITFPVYYLKNKEFYYFQDTYDQIKKFANIEILEEVYIRKNQKVWRQIAMIERT